MRRRLRSNRCNIRRLTRSLYVRQAKLCGGLATLARVAPITFVHDVQLRHTTTLLRRNGRDIGRVTRQAKFDSPDCFAGYFGGRFILSLFRRLALPLRPGCGLVCLRLSGSWALWCGGRGCTGRFVSRYPFKRYYH